MASLPLRSLLVSAAMRFFVVQIGRHPAPLFVSARSSRFIDFAENNLGDYEVHGGRDVFTSCSYQVQHDLDRGAPAVVDGQPGVSRILLFRTRLAASPTIRHGGEPRPV